MNDTYSWTRMLDDFRQLGGKADNIEQRAGQFGNGIFSIDPQQPVEMEIPPALLVDADHLVLDGGDLVVNPDAGVPADVATFIGRYQKHFSWGADGRKHVATFETALATLPGPLLSKLKQLHLVNLEVRHKGSWDEVLRQRFLLSRRINYHDRKVSMPIIELINHSPRSPGYIIKQGIKVRGTFADEVTVNYSPNADSLQRFLTYGFANQEPYAYSLPLRFHSGDGPAIIITYDLAKTDKVDGMPIPKVEVEGKRHKLSYLRIGSESTPRLPRTVLRKALHDLPIATADELFDRIRDINQIELCNMLELADGVDSDIGKEFRRAVLFQMRALTHCYGARPE